MSDFIPNTFQTPNLYIDLLLPLLNDTEVRVLFYITRRILGFQKRQDRISLSQLVNGTKSKKTGENFDFGCGSGETAVKAALRSLTEYGILIQTATYDIRLSLPPEWGLQFDANAINWDSLHSRRNEQHDSAKRRAAKSVATKNDTPPGSSNDTPPGSSNDTPPGSSNDPPLGRPTYYTKDRGNKEGKTGGDHAIQDHPSANGTANLPHKQTASPKGQDVEPSRLIPPSIHLTGDPFMDAAINKANGNGYQRNGDYSKKRPIDDIQSKVAQLNMTIVEFREMVDAFLDKQGLLDLSMADTDNATKTHASAQDTLLSLCAVDPRFRTVVGLNSVYTSWENNDWRGASLPNDDQLIKHAGKMRADKVVCERKDQPLAPNVVPVFNADNYDWTGCENGAMPQPKHPIKPREDYDDPARLRAVDTWRKLMGFPPLAQNAA